MINYHFLRNSILGDWKHKLSFSSSCEQAMHLWKQWCHRFIYTCVLCSRSNSHAQVKRMIMPEADHSAVFVLRILLSLFLWTRLRVFECAFSIFLFGCTHHSEGLCAGVWCFVFFMVLLFKIIPQITDHYHAYYSLLSHFCIFHVNVDCLKKNNRDLLFLS